ncbi:hypothetical protein ABT215_30125 [Streptomyces sp900105755]|uniref:hypothetical protein n=1 Tax=Streptomyces sp. 900105755 TaxID=3154389 RepID=UPI0033314AF0
MGRDAGARSTWTFNTYVERLIVEDTTGACVAGVAAAQRLLAEHSGYLDDLGRRPDAP